MKRSSVVTAMLYMESNFDGMKHFAGFQSWPIKGDQFYHAHIRSEEEGSNTKWTARQSRNC